MHVPAYVHMILCLFGGEADCSSSTEKPYPTAHNHNMRRPQMRDIDALKRRPPPRSHAGSLHFSIGATSLLHLHCVDVIAKKITERNTSR